MGIIKFHQHGIGPEYGSDGTLTSNWDPLKDYGGEYVDVHFRIRAPGYEYPYFSFQDEQRCAFYGDVREILTPLGWSPDGYAGEYKEWNCTYIKSGRQTLYLHPQDFSGVVMKNNVGTIATALSGGKTFSLERVDLYETVYDVTDDEYLQMLAAIEPEIRAKIYSTAHTPNKYSFVNESRLIASVCDSCAPHRVGKEYRFCEQAFSHVTGIVNKMKAEGYIETADGYCEDKPLIRSTNVTDLRRHGLKPPVLAELHKN